jgi:hypothetical protein
MYFVVRLLVKCRGHLCTPLMKAADVERLPKASKFIVQVPMTEAVAKQLRNLNRCYNSYYGYSYYPSYSYYPTTSYSSFNLASLIGR